MADAVSSDGSIDILIEKSYKGNKDTKIHSEADDVAIWIACTIISSLIADSPECKSVAMSARSDNGMTAVTFK